ncbi:hypothetical protein GE09DRAFT_1282024 [Coniochaeta sp. 2T2.1]|nr:hypothetical protein GE09DRAFT_1282024 [Coniochaeta sp. 2T2.1]
MASMSKESIDVAKLADGQPSHTHHQQQSPFFSLLPPEIRQQIYTSLLLTAGQTQHIFKSDIGHAAPISHTACHIDPDGEDDRERRYHACYDSDEAPDSTFAYEQTVYNQKVWRGRQYTDWCGHYICEERYGNDGGSAFLGPMLACKRMSEEFAPLVYGGVTFSFVNVPALKRFVEGTAERHMGLIRSVHLIWCASMETQSVDQEEEYDAETEDPMGSNQQVDSLQTWTDIWTRLSLRAPRLNNVRIWIYGRFPRFPMPAAEYFDVLDRFALGTLNPNPLLQPAKPREMMQSFTIQTVWTREFTGFVADGTELREDDGKTVPDWLRGRTFTVTRVPAVEYEPREWMAMWARPGGLDTAGQDLGAVLKGKGWGLRGRGVKVEEGGQEGFARR